MSGVLSYPSQQPELIYDVSPANAAAVTPSDTAALPVPAMRLYIGTPATSQSLPPLARPSRSCLSLPDSSWRSRSSRSTRRARLPPTSSRCGDGEEVDAEVKYDDRPPVARPHKRKPLRPLHRRKPIDHPPTEAPRGRHTAADDSTGARALLVDDAVAPNHLNPGNVRARKSRITP